MNQLIVSITSYPKRFKNLPTVIKSLNDQTYKDFHILLTLCKSECENDLDLLNEVLAKCVLPVEVNWVEKNTYCHKNTFEAMKKYPDNPILVIDDDLTRKPECIENFVKDYLDYGCIIARNFAYVNNDGVIELSKGGIHRKKSTNECWYFTGKELPVTGFYGILYPPRCFKDERYYDADLILECSPTSTEMWLYYWICKEDKLVYFDFKNDIRSRMDHWTPDSCLYLINSIEKRNEFFQKIQKTLGNLP